MNTEQKPSLPVREETKNKRQDGQIPVNIKDLPSESSEDSSSKEKYQELLEITKGSLSLYAKLLEQLEKQSKFLRHGISEFHKISLLETFFEQMLYKVKKLSNKEEIMDFIRTECQTVKERKFNLASIPSYE